MGLMTNSLQLLLFLASILLTRGYPSRIFRYPGRGRQSFCSASSSEGEPRSAFQQVLFVETGFGCDQHGQNPTKAAVRVARNAIEFNSIPCISAIVPGGYANMLMRVQIAAPDHDKVDVSEVAKVFPYGRVWVELQDGGMRAKCRELAS